MTVGEAGGRLDRFLERTLPDLTRSKIKRLADSGLVWVSGAPAKAGHLLRPGDEVLIRIPPPPAVRPEPEEIPVLVAYEDDAILVVDKPAGLTVHPGAGRPGGTLVNALLGRGTRLSAIGAPYRPGIVHRLDRGTSGLLVVAKTDLAHRRLAAALAERRVSRTYVTIAWGMIDPQEGTIAGSLARSRADRRKMRVVRGGGRQALTRYRVLWTGDGLSVLVLRLETGRTHQIRVHLKHLGHPVFGDPEYGGRGLGSVTAQTRDRARLALLGLDRQALHAARLAFEHPETGQPVEFYSAPPEDILDSARLLGIPEEPLLQSWRENG